MILKSAVANLGSDAVAVIPEFMLIEFVETARSGGGQELYLKLAMTGTSTIGNRIFLRGGTHRPASSSSRD